ncbi:MAG: efflux RND transporter permease subunit [Rhodospirillaceae bacterium]|jgi:hydrophobic/amphiphilic exporter-1 (mainly G- bacteria), HAE1 family|nr:efflux RND transporter permease subunit [Rhodospirillaceae bacterium]MBT3493224.1 efflux RND transporter permease subunit [Rhodospirillaceae bacterium]MBT3782126.1 efflux RND transporter permease subunit [Rhodospirillaceae bacterium]MBT3977645.1 efflux RND transporter permease subunit [Rhodospirillaceae bacterium]MBT4167061.1 efflux RND transporter permease subunit [Rhodospirillaceae bacterium]
MNLIRISIDRPIAVVAAVLMILLFGLLALQTIPIQLTPDVRRPILNIQTTWHGAAPAEIEREIINRQEEALKGLPGVMEITSRSEDGRARISLEFNVTQNMDRALLLVANRLDRVTGYPEEANEPTIGTSSSDDNPIGWFIIDRLPGNEREVHTFGDAVDDLVRDRLERVPGVSRVTVYGGGERELRVVVEPEKLARYRLTVPHVIQALRAANTSISGGDIVEGKRRYVVRTEGEFTTPEQVAAVLVRSEGDRATGRVGRVTVGDIAEVKFAYKSPTAHIRSLGNPTLAANTIRDTGANVIEVMNGIHAAIAELKDVTLPAIGLTIRQVYDETVYINSAIGLVQNNILVGGVLAAVVLLLFLRSARATLVISLAIPVSVVGAFVAMAALGRSLNVISLAGIAFSVGMVVDAAIVVLENIYRHRQEGTRPKIAAFLGAQQVWGAILVSALTTVLVFLPLLVMKLEVGQLFRDIAVAISVSVLLSLVVSVTVVPALSRRLLREGMKSLESPVRLPLLDDFAAAFSNGVMHFTHRVVKSRALAITVVAVLCGAGAIATWAFLPKLDYLPDGNRNLIFGVILPPPGYNLDTTTAIAEELETTVRPLWAKESGPESEPGQPPKIENFFFVAARATTFIGASSMEPKRVGELIPVLRAPIFKEPGTYGFISKRSLFGRGIGGGRSINLDVSGPDLDEVLGVARQAARLIGASLPREQGNQLRPKPGLELGAPEIRVIPDPVLLADNGVSALELGQTVDALNDGLRVAEITVDGRRIDLMLVGPEGRITETQGIGNLPVVTRSGTILSADALARIEVTAGPTEIRHVERVRTVTLEVRPRPDLPLEAAMDILQNKVIDKLAGQGLPPAVKMRLSGTADKLTAAWDHLVVDLAVAVVIVYLVMAVLFESFLYPLIILFSVPLATAGGVLGLALLNLFSFQPLDMLTMLGFVILIGIVVNNAILIVHQTLFLVRSEGLHADAAIIEAVRNRIRPIFMSTLTSVFGMLPLVVFPGAGSELYRGLGSVVLGGLSLSAVLTLLIIPPLLSLVSAVVERGRNVDGKESVQAAE